jgi:dihydropyrimidinase
VTRAASDSRVDRALVGGDVVLPGGVQRIGVAIDAGRIVALGPEAELPAARELLDVSGCVVLPGAVDVHLHYDRDGRLTDRVGDATRSAACGGVTSAIAFLLWQPERRLGSTLDEAIAELARESFLDIGFHFYLHANDFGALEEIPALVQRGVTSFKMAMAYKRRGMMCSDEFLLAAFQAISRGGGMAMLHAESGEAIDVLEQRAIADGRVRPVDYSQTRPDYSEAESISRAATLAAVTSCPAYIVHLSSRRGLQQLLALQAAGHDIQAETCPQYLTLTEREMERQGPLAKIAPPLRTAADQAALWQALGTGQLNVVASDHAPYPSEAKKVGWQNIFESPFGAPTIETLLPLLYSEGVRKRGLGLEWLARVTSEQPARLFGLHPRKGTLEVGADADVVVLDPARQVTIDARKLHSNADYTPFQGIVVDGWPLMTVASGEVLVRDGVLQRDAGIAHFLARPKVSGPLSQRLRTRL